MCHWILVCAADFNESAFLQTCEKAVDVIVAVDGGLAHLASCGVAPQVILGDFDSLGYVPQAEDFPAARIIIHPCQKDASDLELALDLAVAEGATQVSVFGVLGGRLDQTVASLEVASAYGCRFVALRLVGADAEVHVVASGQSLELVPDDAVRYISVFALGEPALGVEIDGLKYPFRGTLHAGTSLGMSNEFAGKTGSVRVGQGTVLVICQR